LLRTLIGEVIVTADHDTHRAAVEVQWQGGARTELSFPLKVPGRLGVERRLISARRGAFVPLCVGTKLAGLARS
jgi:hypothetical protein